jgi:hypothetical protein
MVIISNEVDLLQLCGLHLQTGGSTRYFQYRLEIDVQHSPNVWFMQWKELLYREVCYPCLQAKGRQPSSTAAAFGIDLTFQEPLVRERPSA